MDNPISVEYTDYELRNLVEEYITQQKSEFTLKGVCSYVLYWAVEDDKVAQGDSLIEGNAISNADQDRVKRLLEAVVTDGRIVSVSDGTFQKR